MGFLTASMLDMDKGFTPSQMVDHILFDIFHNVSHMTKFYQSTHKACIKF